MHLANGCIPHLSYIAGPLTLFSTSGHTVSQTLQYVSHNTSGHSHIPRYQVVSTLCIVDMLCVYCDHNVVELYKTKILMHMKSCHQNQLKNIAIT